jgi:hypothetical protein
MVETCLSRGGVYLRLWSSKMWRCGRRVTVTTAASSSPETLVHTSTSETKFCHYTSLRSLLLVTILFAQRLPITKFGVQHCILHPFILTDVVSLHLLLRFVNQNRLMLSGSVGDLFSSAVMLPILRF